MADTASASTKAPWHLWVVGVVSLLWNAVGALDFTMTQLEVTAYLKGLTPAQLEYIYGFPFWAVLVWGVGTWGSLLGSLFLLLRRRFAVKLFGASIIGALLTNLYSYGLSDGLKVMQNGVGAVIFSVVICVIVILLFVYARAMRQRGILR
jgi:hypothetical protein